MNASTHKFALAAVTAVALLAGASAAWVVQARHSAPAVATVKLERVVITGKRQVSAAQASSAQLAQLSQADAAIVHLPRVVIEARRVAEPVLVAQAAACKVQALC